MLGQTSIQQLLDISERASHLIEVGGFVVLILMAMSFVALTIVVVKLLQFGLVGVGQSRSANQALVYWRASKPKEALAMVAEKRKPVDQVVARAIRGKQLGLPDAQVREEILRYGGDVLFQLRRGFRPLEMIGSLAPLLGLLGTVMGMIKAFQQLEAAGNQVNPAILSGGIWEALLTTAVGLVVAIPVAAVLSWLERRVDHLAHNMDNLVTQVFTEDLSG
jgi:biopolymer transport protein ExbB